MTDILFKHFFMSMIIYSLELCILCSTYLYILIFSVTSKKEWCFTKQKLYEVTLLAYKSRYEPMRMKMFNGPLWAFFPHFPYAFVHCHSTFGKQVRFTVFVPIYMRSGKRGESGYKSLNFF